MSKPINPETVNKIIELFSKGGSVTDAITVLGDDPDTWAAASAVATLRSQLPMNQGVKWTISTTSLQLALQATFRSWDDGKFTISDITTTSAALGAVLARIPYKPAQTVAAYFNLLALAPTLGRLLGDVAYDLFNDDISAEANLDQAKAVDPLALDLNGDGIINTVGTNAGVLFDHNGDGIKTGTGWLQGGSNSDGLLVWDKNNNGKIDNGTELFGVDFIKQNGNKATSGFDALADLDTNKDGIFDNKDNKFNKIKVWQDKNQDGISQTAELKTLAQHNIKSINLHTKQKSKDLKNGNKQIKVWRLVA